MNDDQQSEDLKDRIRAAAASGEPVDDVLRTDERVLARITDGIYRQPASAIRELIANAYDADATTVVINTDPPRFNRITIRDNGSGMSIETLSHVLHHIGGSLKRTDKGSELSVASASNVQKSPGGRQLIGRIGIGLFSVVQLTPHFQIITKVKGAPYRLVADIIMSSETIEQATRRSRGNKELTTGRVRIWSEPAADLDTQGTDIILLDVRPQTKDMLRSTARWQSLQVDGDTLPADWLPTATTAPTFHIGGLSFVDDGVIATAAALPWKDGSSADEKFRSLVTSVRGQTKSVTSPELKDSLDNYFQMIWTLSLGLPSRYVDVHPFDIPVSELECYVLSNDKKGQARRLDNSSRTAREEVGLLAPEGYEDDAFGVVIDGIKLARPITTKRANLKTSTSISRDLIFFGSCTPDLSSIAEEFRGGPLSFEAYIYWSPKVVPKDHNGVLVRIKGASGTLFDGSFLGYQVAENTRLKQLTAEIFVKEGLEGALNIDRESFNYANIHYQFLSRWLHGAIRQVANRHKSASSASAKTRRGEKASRFEAELASIADRVWIRETANEDESPPELLISNEQADTGDGRDYGLAISRSQLYSFAPSTAKVRVSAQLEARIATLYQVLHAHGVLSGMSYDRQQALIRDIANILNVEA